MGLTIRKTNVELDFQYGEKGRISKNYKLVKILYIIN